MSQSRVSVLLNWFFVFNKRTFQVVSVLVCHCLYIEVGEEAIRVFVFQAPFCFYLKLFLKLISQYDVAKAERAIGKNKIGKVLCIQIVEGLREGGQTQELGKYERLWSQEGKYSELNFQIKISIPGGQRIETRRTVIWAKGKVSLNWNGDSENGEEGMIEEKVQKEI